MRIQMKHAKAKQQLHQIKFYSSYTKIAPRLQNNCTKVARTSVHSVISLQVIPTTKYGHSYSVATVRSEFNVATCNNVITYLYYIQNKWHKSILHIKNSINLSYSWRLMCSLETVLLISYLYNLMDQQLELKNFQSTLIQNNKTSLLMKDWSSGYGTSFSFPHSKVAMKN